MPWLGFLLLLVVHGRRAPWFNGWCTRIVDHTTQRSITLILGTFQAAFSQHLTEAYAAVLVASHNSSLHVEQVFHDPSRVVIAQNGISLAKLPANGRNFTWTSPIGELQVDGSTSKLGFAFPGLRLTASLTGRVPWDSSRPNAGPEGWVGSLPGPLLPTHYFVRTLSSQASYSVDGQSGRGIAHQEANSGMRFPVAFVWAQAVADEGLSLLLTGGKFTVAGITTLQYIIAYRSQKKHWNFRSIDLDKIVAVADACSGSISLSASSRAGNRHLEIEISAPVQSFSEGIYIPTESGFSNEPGSVESHTATAVVRACTDTQCDELSSESTSFTQVALEFGGQYVCKSDSVQNGLSQHVSAFVSPQGSRARSGRFSTAAHMGSQKQRGTPELKIYASFERRGLGHVACTATRHAAWWAAACFAVAALVKVSRKRKRRSLQQGIADFYDASSGVWIEIWGEHMHHGYYPDSSWRTLVQHKEAQVRMIEEILKWAEVPQPGTATAPKDILDVGCGVGGSSRHLQRKYGGCVQGITLSPKQRDRAQIFSEQAGQGTTCGFSVTDALCMHFPDDSFDLVWSLESGEHMPDKKKFLSEMFRVCRPHGRVILVTWVHRDLEDGESLTSGERRLLNWINKAYHLPAWCSITDYAKIAEQQFGVSGLRTADWTKYIAPFWSAVIRTALQPRGWWALARGGWETFRGALVMPLMNRGYRSGTIKFGLLTACKPAQTSRGDAQHKASTASSALGKKMADIRCCRFAGFEKQPKWRTHPCRTLMKASQRSVSSCIALCNCHMLRTLWDFTRPHTLIGTLISILSVHLFAVAPMFSAPARMNQPVFLSKLVLTTLRALVPALLINVYITGLNQIFDIQIDKQNKPDLPLASGRLSVPVAWCVVAFSLALAGFLACSYPSESGGWMLQLPLICSALLGTAYSAPPLRLKRFPFLAAFCIVVVRGVVVNLGFYHYVLNAMGLAAQASNFRSCLAAGFFAVFGLVIALLKDVPDVLGDKAANIRSLTVRLGPEQAFAMAVGILKCHFAVTSCAFAFTCASAIISVAHPRVALARGALAAIALLSCKLVKKKQDRVDPQNPRNVSAFYMFVWNLFYVSYLLLPLAQ